MFSRRNFIRMAGALGSLGMGDKLGRFGLMSALAAKHPASSDYRALVCVFLQGGNDSNNMLIPMDSIGFSNYSLVRQQVGLSESSLLPIGANGGATPYGMHPNLPELQTLYNNKQMAFLANVGTLVKPINRTQFLAGSVPVPDNLLSHSDQQNQWQSAVTLGTSNTGWAGRAADVIAPMNAPSTFPTMVSLSGNTLFANGSVTQPATIAPGALPSLAMLTGVGASQRATAFSQLLTFDSGVSLIQTANNVMTTSMNYMGELQLAFNGAPPITTVFPSTTLGSQLQQVAKIIQVRGALGMNRQIFFCMLNGFDTHGNLLGFQSQLYPEVSQAMSAFFNATVELGVAPNVTTFTESEFSRTLQPTSISGSDHGWGGHHMIVGGAVKGGEVYGTFPQLVLSGPDDSGSRGTWIPTIALEQYGANLASWFGVGTSDMPKLFPNLANFPSGLLGFI